MGRIAIKAAIAFLLLVGLLHDWNGARAAQAEDVAAYKAVVEQRFAEWLESLWPQAEQEGVSRKTFDANVKGLKLNWSLPHLILPNPAAPGGPALPQAMAQAQIPKHQPEFDAPAGYFNAGTMKSLAATGRAKFQQYGNEFAAIQKQYNVPASIVVAIWGRETGFGKVDSANDALQTMATQAFMGRRPEEFTKQFIAALKILQEGHATRAAMRSSWAGAMGYTQFMPSDFENYGVDFDGDGKRDIWNSIPDALASTGNSLHTQGWDGSQTWAYEVTLPANFDCSLQGPDIAKPISEWVKLGVARVKDKPFPEAKANDSTFL